MYINKFKLLLDKKIELCDGIYQKGEIIIGIQDELWMLTDHECEADEVAGGDDGEDSKRIKYNFLVSERAQSQILKEVLGSYPPCKEEEGEK